MSVAQPLPRSWLSPLWNWNSVRVQSGSPHASERFVCAYQAVGVWGCPSGNRPRVLNTEELEEKTLSAWRTQHSQCRGHWRSTRTLIHTQTQTHKQQMLSCIHAYTLSLPLSLFHICTHPLSFSLFSLSLYFAPTTTQSEHFNSIALLIFPLLPCSVKIAPWGQKSSGQGDNRKAAQTGNCWHIMRR